MFIAVQANLRTAAAAQRSVRDAVNVSLRGGAVSGFLVVALSLLGVLAMYAVFGGFNAAAPGATPAQRLVDGVASVPFEIVGFGFGASFVALFAQLGGGIYTKAADVGADLVGKIEAGIPEDDPRNAAVIADLVVCRHGQHVVGVLPACRAFCRHHRLHRRHPRRWRRRCD
jgi:K(+)-stimulated pyrophosphate-energized sodium pump